MTKVEYSTYKVIKKASPSSKLETNRVFKLLRDGQARVVVSERKEKICAAT